MRFALAGQVDFATLPRRWTDGLRFDPATRERGRQLNHVVGPGFEIRVVGARARLAVWPEGFVASTGIPRFLTAPAERAAESGDGSAWWQLYREHTDRAPEQVRGPFAVVVVDFERRSALLATDRFGVQPLCWGYGDSVLAFSDRADSVPLLSSSIDTQALFDYLYFHVIPGPHTVFRGVSRLNWGSAVSIAGGQSRVFRHWAPRFDEHDRQSIPELARSFRQLLTTAVSREVAAGRVGAFLSGGTDSSTVAGLLREVTGEPARTYSIGFNARGYDEVEYARIAARHFATDHHEYYVTPEDVLSAIPEVAVHFDQPFGNSSVVPAYLCARRAKEDGVERLLAGDGGDELFGGNTRYAKQKIFEIYQAVPRPIRTGLVEPALLGHAFWKSLPGARKLVSYVEQARVPMPDRLSMDNLLARLGVERVLTPAFLAQVDTSAPVLAQREVYALTNATSLVNRMLAYDWKYTLADSDLPKVCGATALAGIDVGFPLLDADLTDFSLTLAPKLKVRGLTLRWFFKQALRDFLPREIIAKKKHGFGLPFGVWLSEHSGLQRLARDALESLGARGVARPEFLKEILGNRLAEHPGYYGEMVWILVVMEHWLARHAPSFSVR